MNNTEFLENNVKTHKKNMKEKQETLDILKGVVETIKKVNSNYARELIYEAERQLLFCKRAFDGATDSLKNLKTDITNTEAAKEQTAKEREAFDNLPLEEKVEILLKQVGIK